MKYVHIDDVSAGQILGKTIFSGNGATLLSENVQLTVPMINTMKRIGVTTVHIKDSNFDDVQIEDVVSDETKRMVIKKMGDIYQTVKSGKEFNTKVVTGSVNHLLDEIMENKHVLAQLNDIRTEDNHQFIHAMNVCITSILIGLSVDLTPSQLKELATGALLHDIGKVGMTDEDDPQEPRRQHTWRGFELIKMKHELSLLVAHICLQHHETTDGKGAPRGLEGDQIHLYAKIVAVANTYDNLVSSFTGNRSMLPHEACEHLMALAGTKLEHELVLHFLRSVSVYPTGVSVRLSTREIGVVVGQHRGLPSRPVIRVIKQEDEELQVKEMDLAQNPTVFIEAVL